MEFIDIKAQYQLYKKEIDQAIHEVLDSGNFILGEQVSLLEQKLAAYAGVKHCITAASGTDTLLMALMALGVGYGDEVITTPFTFFSTAEVISLLGAKPVFVDIEPEYYNIDVSKIEEAITKKTKAVMPVSLFGQMPDFREINAVAERYGLPVIEDAAQSFGATQWGKVSCGVSTIGSTSFYPAKPLGCYGDGGALFTDDDVLADKLFALRNHGSRKRHYYPMIGINGRFDTIQAAVLLAKFSHYPSEVAARNRLGARYSELLADVCKTPKVQEGNTHVYAQYTIRVPDRDQFADRLKAKGIPTSIYYPVCLHEQPVYADLGYPKGSFPVAEQAAREVISLPMHPWLTEEDLGQVADAVREALSMRVCEV